TLKETSGRNADSAATSPPSLRDVAQSKRLAPPPRRFGPAGDRAHPCGSEPLRAVFGGLLAKSSPYAHREVRSQENSAWGRPPPRLVFQRCRLAGCPD